MILFNPACWGCEFLLEGCTTVKLGVMLVDFVSLEGVANVSGGIFFCFSFDAVAVSRNFVDNFGV